MADEHNVSDEDNEAWAAWALGAGRKARTVEIPQTDGRSEQRRADEHDRAVSFFGLPVAEPEQPTADEVEADKQARRVFGLADDGSQY